MTAAHVGLFIGSTLGVGLMCILSMSGPSADDAIWHLSHLFWLVDEGVCDFRNGNVHGNIDEGTVTAMRILENTERYLLNVGDEYVMSTRGKL